MAASRRTVLRSGLFGAAVLAGGAGLLGAPGRADARVAAYEGDVPLNRGWLFGGEYTEGSADPGFDDGGFRTVTLPHTVAELSWRDWDPAAWEKVWIYRRHLDDVPPPRPGTRVFADFAGVMTSATAWLNGHELGTHRGGYLPWSVELTGRLNAHGNVLAVAVDGRWQQVPPDGAAGGAAAVDYLQPAGIYRDVRLRAVPETFIADVFAKPVDVLSDARQVEVTATLDAATAPGPLRVEAGLYDGDRRLAAAATTVGPSGPGVSAVRLTLRDLGPVTLWSPDTPKLYTVVTSLASADARHTVRTRIGFREARFAVDGFYLNGERFKLFGVNRHQLYPYAGMAMPARVQRRDAEIVRRELNANMVRCSHYPQSPDFLDACDELGLMVWEEPPGWQYVGDAAFQDLAVADVRAMVTRDRNRPSVIIWGTRLNETHNYPDFYRRTRAAADALDGTRPTSGSMYLHDTTDWAQDVFAFDDYHRDSSGEATLLEPLPGVPYLVTEAVGALDGPPYFRWTDTADVLAQQARMHARVHDIARSDDRYAGLLGWAGFDYASLNGHIRSNVKWPGVVDGFRVPKPGAAFYRSQVDPRVRPVIEPVFFWDFGDRSPSGGPGEDAMIATNCDRLEIFVSGRHVATAKPARDRYPHLAYPPAFADLTVSGGAHPDLRIDGYVGDRLVGTRRMSSDPAHDRLLAAADDREIIADGGDATRVWFRAADAYGNQRPYVTGDVTLTPSGPADLIGDNPFAFADYGGVGAVWLRSRPGRPGDVRLTLIHPTLGRRTVRVRTVLRDPQPEH